ncbi:hypothetical protein MNBD_NITROSPIRAE01-1247 [hydrothermal vent metagenome]|uniref:Outer membrane lipoprotein BamD-like domain-containing protein n=1 Tax=hydrothermal vent metagenome TaxID=652676 RepID=A0A3B1CF96_9ZZZZ
MSQLKKIHLIFLGLLLLFSFTACSNPEGKSAQLYETAQFEEEQFNIEHATKLYEEILKKYPESDFAGKAKKRLEALKAESP